jgi:hypothetical protein
MVRWRWSPGGRVRAARRAAPRRRAAHWSLQTAGGAGWVQGEGTAYRQAGLACSPGFVCNHAPHSRGHCMRENRETDEGNPTSIV